MSEAPIEINLVVHKMTCKNCQSISEPMQEKHLLALKPGSHTARIRYEGPVPHNVTTKVIVINGTSAYCLACFPIQSFTQERTIASKKPRKRSGLTLKELISLGVRDLISKEDKP